MKWKKGYGIEYHFIIMKIAGRKCRRHRDPSLTEVSSSEHRHEDLSGMGGKSFHAVLAIDMRCASGSWGPLRSCPASNWHLASFLLGSSTRVEENYNPVYHLSHPDNISVPWSCLDSIQYQLCITWLKYMAKRRLKGLKPIQIHLNFLNKTLSKLLFFLSFWKVQQNVIDRLVLTQLSLDTCWFPSRLEGEKQSNKDHFLQ